MAKNVLAENIGAAITAHNNIEGIMALLSQISQSLTQYTDSKAQELVGQINSVQQALQDSINQLDNKLTQVEAAAKILEDYELGQIEDILNTVFSQLAAEGFIEKLCLDLNGQSVSLKDLVTKLALADQIQKTMLDIDPETEKITAIRYTLTDDTEQVLTYDSTQDITDDNGNLLYKVDIYKTDNWKGTGVPAVKERYYKPRTFTVSVGTTTLNQEIELYMGESNLVFDLAVAACPYSSDTVPQTPDLNQDGKVGNA